MVTINEQAPGFEAQAFHNNEITKVKLSDHKGKWVILVFYPADFTFICPQYIKSCSYAGLRHHMVMLSYWLL